ncbi:MAG: hypothetical protein V4747_11435 [Pseudomonadota bacterium]
MSYTQIQLDALRTAVARGVRTVTTDGNTVTYASTDEMLRLIAIIERDIAAATRRSRIHYPTFERGT